MLVISTGKKEEIITIGKEINIKITKLDNGIMRISVNAPKDMDIKVKE